MHPANPTEFQRAHRKAIVRYASVLVSALIPTTDPANAAAGCAFEAQGEDHVAAIIDARTFRLGDGREIRLAGIEPAMSERSETLSRNPADRTPALATILADHEVKLRGEDDTPDRYGRQTAFVFVGPSETLVQAELLTQGEALVSATVTDKGCAAALLAAEAAARQAKRGLWGYPTAIKNPESPGDILAGSWAIYAGRGQGFVRPAGRGNDLPEFWPELDTGFCCDYFKAGAQLFSRREARHRSRKFARKSADSRARLR